MKGSIMTIFGLCLLMAVQTMLAAGNWSVKAGTWCTGIDGCTGNAGCRTGGQVTSPCIITCNDGSWVECKRSGRADELEVIQ